MASFSNRDGINLEDDGSTSNILLDVVLTKIIQNFSIAELSKLELVSKQFQRCVHNAYRPLRTLDLKTIFLPEFGKYLKADVTEYNTYGEKIVRCFLEKLVYRCQLLQTILGLDCLDSISPHHLVLLSELTELKNFTFENVFADSGQLSCFLKKFPKMESLTLICDDKRRPHLSSDDSYFDFFKTFYGLIELTMTNIKCSGSFLSTVVAENLKVLNFNGSSFSFSYVGALLTRCVNLEILQLYGTFLDCRTEYFEEVLQCLPNLKKLYKFELSVKHDYYSVSEDDEVSEFVVTLDSGTLLNVLAKCQNLRHIILRSDYVVEIVNDNFLSRIIAKCPNLEALDFSLDRCDSEEIVSNIEYLGNLTSLILHNEKSYNTTLLNCLCSKLHKLDNLSHLELWGIEETDLALLSNVKNLTDFTYSGRITNAVWIESGFLRNVKVLKLYCDFVEDEIMKSVFENAPNLNSFFTFALLAISDETLLVIAECCKCLEKLDIPRCKGYSENGLLKFLSSCICLRYINTNFCYKDISSNVLFELFKHIVWCNH